MYRIEIKKIETRTTESREWKQVHVHNETCRRAPDRVTGAHLACEKEEFKYVAGPVTLKIDQIVFMQEVEEIDLPDIIAAVNGLELHTIEAE